MFLNVHYINHMLGRLTFFLIQLTELYQSTYLFFLLILVMQQMWLRGKTQVKIYIYHLRSFILRLMQIQFTYWNNSHSLLIPICTHPNIVMTEGVHLEVISSESVSVMQYWMIDRIHTTFMCPGKRKNIPIAESVAQPQLKRTSLWCLILKKNACI